MKKLIIDDFEGHIQYTGSKSITNIFITKNKPFESSYYITIMGYQELLNLELMLKLYKEQFEKYHKIDIKKEK